MAVEREISVRDRERDLEERVIELVLDRERSMMISGVHIGHSPLIAGSTETTPSTVYKKHRDFWHSSVSKFFQKYH